MASCNGCCIPYGVVTEWRTLRCTVLCRSPLLLGNGVDCARFQPGPFVPAAAAGVKAKHPESFSRQLLMEAALSVRCESASAAVRQESAAAAAAGPSPSYLATSASQKAAAACEPGSSSHQPKFQERTGLQLPGVAAGAADTAQPPPLAASVAAASLGLKGIPIDFEDTAQLSACCSQPDADIIQNNSCQCNHQQASCKVGACAASASVPTNSNSKTGSQLDPACISTDPSPGSQPEGYRVLLVGNPTLNLKGFDIAIAVLARVSRSIGPIAVRWLCQKPPSMAALAALQVLRPSLRFEIIVDPPQVRCCVVLCKEPVSWWKHQL